MSFFFQMLLFAPPLRFSRQRRGIAALAEIDSSKCCPKGERSESMRRQRCRGLPASATPLSKAPGCPNAQPALDDSVVGAKGLRLAPLPPHSTTLTREKGDKAVKTYLHEFDDLILTTAIDYHHAKLSDEYDNVLVKILLSRVQKKGGH